jgi:hypothetical protein
LKSQRDVTHCFALLFRDEAIEAGFFELDVPPEPMHAPTDWALDLLAAYQ